MSTKLTPKQTRVFNEALNRADQSNDVKTKTDADGKYIRTPWALCEEIVGQIVAQTSLRGKKILVVDTVEFIPVLLAFGAEKRNITYVAPYEYKGKIASAVGVRVVQQNLLEWKPDMKFDVVIGNPPYNKGLIKGIKNEFTKNASGYPHLAFVNKCLSLSKPDGVVSMLMPASFMTLVSCDTFRRTVMENYGVSTIFLYDNRRNQVFDIEHTWICNVFFTGTKQSNNTEYIIESEGTIEKFKIDLLNYSSVDNGEEVLPWPMLLSEISSSILLKAKQKSKPIRRAVANEDLTGKHYVGFVLQGEDDNPRVGGIPLSKKGNGEIKAPGFLIFEDYNSAVRYCRFMKTKTYKFLLSTTKCISKTQPQFISLIGDFDFPNDEFTDAELYAHFNLTQEEIDYIEETIK